ncbi:MAG: T9SS type A sorting domain-containing protein [Calditrichaeota bacterium]|nr:T9SS type A sorting domain-containing protein [Calditrichota bacterium]
MKKITHFSFYLIVLLFSSWVYSQNCADSINIYTFTYKGKKYEVVKENKTWADAAACADARGGILAHINSQEEMDSIFYYVNLAGISTSQTKAPDGGNASYIWLGGNDLIEEGKWVWDGSNYGMGVQFWQGTNLGSPVDSLYNNWGNEPDNFSDQDGLGLALTNWPRGTAGQWNDVNAANQLYYLIEYDHSTVHLEKVEYSYHEKVLKIHLNLKMNYDSLQVTLNSIYQQTFFNLSIQDSVLSFPITFDISRNIDVRIFAYKDSIKALSKSISHEVYSFQNPQNSYMTDFENSPQTDFIGDGFNIEKFFGFRNIAIHSQHTYAEGTDYTFTLIKPIIVSHSDSRMIYSDVALVEPGEEGSVFGDENFKDYVIVEATKTGDSWLPLADGYDARYSSVWENAFSNGGTYRNMFVSHTIDLGSVFNAGDTILIRFRFYSDQEITGWGWVIDSLQIQDLTLAIDKPEMGIKGFDLKQNYPNPFNPVTIVTMHLAEPGMVKLSVFDIQGRLVSRLVEKRYNPGIYTVEWNAAELASSVYYLLMEAGGKTFIKKSILLK